MGTSKAYDGEQAQVSKVWWSDVSGHFLGARPGRPTEVVAGIQLLRRPQSKAAPSMGLG